MQFAYHNHWFEFLPTDGKLPYDELLKLCDASLVKMEMDLSGSLRPVPIRSSIPMLTPDASRSSM